MAYWVSRLGKFGVFSLWALCLGAASGQDAPSAASDLSSSPTAQVVSAEARALLDRLATRFEGLQTLEVRFEQVRLHPDFDDETRSSGHLYVRLPDALRCEYDRPEPSTVLFVNDTFYQYTPSLKQVDMTRFESPEAAQRHLRTMLLGFGLSTSEILESYRVEAPDAGNDDAASLRFVPLREDVSRTFESFRVWFDPESLTPRQVRIVEVAGDVVTLDVKRVEVNKTIDPARFEPDFPDSAETIDHSVGAKPTDGRASQ